MRASGGTGPKERNRGSDRGDRGGRKDPKRSRSGDRGYDQGTPRTRSRDRGSRNQYGERDWNRKSPGERSRDDGTRDRTHRDSEGERGSGNFGDRKDPKRSRSGGRGNDQGPPRARSRERQESRSRSRRGRLNSEGGDSYYGPPGAVTSTRPSNSKDPTPQKGPTEEGEGKEQEGTGEGGVTPVQASPQDEQRKRKPKKKKDKTDRVRNLAPDHDSEVDSSGSEDTEDENTRLTLENKALKARVAYLEPREKEISEEAIKEIVNTRTKTLQQTISQKSTSERVLQDKLRALRKDWDDDKGRWTEDTTRLRKGRDEARTDAERVRGERDAWKGKADTASYEAATQKTRADELDKRTEELLRRAVAAEVRLSERVGRNEDEEGADEGIQNSEGVDAVAIAMGVLRQREAEEALRQEETEEFRLQKEAEDKQQKMRDDLEGMIAATTLTPVAATGRTQGEPVIRPTQGGPLATLPGIAEAKGSVEQNTEATKGAKQAKGKSAKITAPERPRRGSGSLGDAGEGLSPNTMLNAAERGRAKSKTAAKVSQPRGTSSTISAQIAEAKLAYTAAQDAKRREEEAAQNARLMEEDTPLDYGDDEEEEEEGPPEA